MRPQVLLVLVAFNLTTAAVAAADDGGAAHDEGVAALDEAALLARLEQADPRFARLAADIDVAIAEVAAVAVRAEPEVELEREQAFGGGGGATSYARLTVPLDLSGRRGRRIAAARTAVAATRADTEHARLELLVDAMRVFDEAAHARRHLETLRAERAALVRVVDIVRKRAGAGASSGYDLQRFELELDAYDDLLATADTRLHAARIALATLLGAPEPLLDAVSALALPRRPPPLAELTTTILDHRADHRAALLRVRGADQLVAEAGRAWIPGLGISAGAIWQDVGDAQAFGYTAGLSLSLPIFDRGRAARARAQAARRVAAADARAIEVRVGGTLRARHAVLERRIDQAERLAAGPLARLEGLLRAAETAYREGEGNVVELLDAYQTARDLRLRDLDLRRDARLAALDLWLVSGRRP